MVTKFAASKPNQVIVRLDNLVTPFVAAKPSQAIVRLIMWSLSV
jgi:hypothetical protein